MTFSLIASVAAQASSNVTTAAINTTGANLLVVQANSFTVSTFSDSAGNTWTQIGPFNIGSNRNSLFYTTNPITSASHTFSYAGSSNFAGIAATAWSGSIGSNAFDKSANATGSSVTTLAAGSITPTFSNSLVIMALGTDGGTSIGISSGTILQNLPHATSEGVAIAYIIQGAAAPVNPSWSWTTASNASAIIAAFESPATLPPLPLATTALFDNLSRHWRVTITGVANGGSSSVFTSKGYQIGEYALTGTLGSGGTAQWKGSNDGVNFVSVGSSITSIPATGLIASPDNGVYAFYRLDATAGDATTSFNAAVDFSSQNMS